MTYFRLFIALLIATSTVQAANEDQIAYFAPEQDEQNRHIETGSRITTCKAAPTIDKDFKLNVLVPESTGYTHQTQPTLYWAVSQPISGQFEFFIEEIPDSEDDYIEPLIEDQFKLNVSAGIHALPLTQYQVELKKGTKYRWSLRLLCDLKGRKSAEDPNASGTLKRMSPSPTLSKQIKETKQQKLPHLYAQHGFWFDALETLSKQIQAHPDNKTLYEIRANLLEQVKLPEVAALDRR